MPFAYAVDHPLDSWVRIVALVMTIVGLALAGKRIVFLFRLITAGQPAPDRIEGVTKRVGLAIKTQLVEVLGQKKLLKWSVPGAAHASVFYAFVILGTVYLEAFGILISGNASWHIPLVGEWEVIGFAQDTIALLALVGIVVFWQIRMKNSPAKLGRDSRFFKSKLFGAYLVLFLIFNVVWTMFFFRGAASALDNLPYDSGAYGSIAVGNLMDGLSEGTLETLEGIGLLLHIAVMFIFLIEVVNSKHLHVFVAPINVMFGRRPVALGAVKNLISDGKTITLDDVDDLDEDSKLGVGTVEDFSWKATLDFATCTECGRCQSQCPAWNTEKPLSPKLLIMALRDASFARGDHTIASEAGKAKMVEAAGEGDTLTKELERPLVGDTGDDWFYMPEDGSGVIDPDVLWSCVNCGACVEQCPVDIEHVDHIVDMRRYQVLVESNFPAELNQLFKGMENKGNPWNMSSSARMDWAKDLPFEVKVVGESIESLDEVDWLFWVGCAGAYEDRAKKTTRAVAELLDIAGVSFGVLGNGETCTGDSARRAGNEFLFQGLAQQNVEVMKEYKVKKVVSTCAHCFNTLKNEYKDFGIELEVVHHTQLLNRLVREGKLTPVKDGAGAHKRSITYHDPCFIGRHNGVYSPPRELLQILPGASYVEMERNSERSFCCGAGGARMWMEETIGERINENRTAEAVGTGADQIAVGCPFCRVMLSDGLTAAQANGDAREEVEVLDVAQMLLSSVKGEQATKLAPGEGAADGGAAAKKAEPDTDKDVATKAEPDSGDVTVTDDTVVDTEDAGPAAKASGGTSLFDDASSMFDEPAKKEAPAESKSSESDKAGKSDEAPAKPAESSGGSLFDLGGDDAPAESESKSESKSEAKSEPAKDEKATAPADELGSGGSLFDVAADEPAAKSEAPAKSEEPAEEKPAESSAKPAEAKDDKPAKPAAEPATDLGGGGSLFDIEAPAEPEAKAAEPEPAAEEPAADAEEADEPAAEEKPAEPEPEEKQEKKAPAASAKPAAAPAAAIPEGGSLFDIEAPAEPAPAAKSAQPAEPAEVPETEDEDSAEEPAPEAAADETEADDANADSAEDEAEDATDDAAPEADDSSDEASTEDSAEAEDDSTEEAKKAEPAESSKPVNSGEANQPKTDVDISGSSSLFDL